MSMNDAENLSKLLGHLPPAVFREFMVEEFELTMPDWTRSRPSVINVQKWKLFSPGSTSIIGSASKKLLSVLSCCQMEPDKTSSKVFVTTSSIRKTRKHLQRFATSTSAHCGCTSMRRPCLRKR
jgi:hypothetical protein